MKDLASMLAQAVDIPTLLRNANAVVNGAGADLAGFNGASVQFTVGAWTDGSLACKIQDSPDNSVWTDVVASQTIGGAAGANLQTIAAANTVKEIGYMGSKRYLRGVITQSGATTGATYGSNLQLGYGTKPPV